MIKKIICLLLCLSVFCFVSPINFVKASTHTHDDNCYAGEVHIHEGTEYKKSGCYQGTYTPGETIFCGDYQGVYPPTVSISSTGKRYCSQCGESRYPDISFIQYRCSTCWESKTIITGRYCGYCGYAFYEDTFTYGPTSGTHSKTLPGTYALNCGMEEEKYYDANGEECSQVCNAVVTNLSIYKE